MFTRILNLLKPLIIILTSLTFCILTFLRLLLTLTPVTPRDFNQQWFASFWTFWGPISAAKDRPFTSKIMSQAHGIVIDLGPGSGLTLPYLDPTKLHHIYGIEPCTHLHPQLSRNIAASGLSGRYEILSIGAEECSKRIERESVDSIVCCKVLCGVPEPERVLEELYGLLKPRGEVLVFEHVLNGESLVARVWQGVLQIVWPYMFAGCNVDRDTERMLRECGEWESVELERPKGEMKWDVIPHIVGKLVKAGK
ncbi:S-adenosyl-L-methionine-dependent methyltransferase [Trichophaea hybrida]|nr:S-adenosyl-L-methionine-dependent methyltransferase [Trichophaea hybrida]